MTAAALPAGPSAPPVAQTLRWLYRPLDFMDACRRRYGDAFSVRFLGFRSPMVMLSDPASVRALYGERSHGLPPGRTLALLPVVGSRSLLLLEGGEHLAHRKLMLPPFHGERMRAYEPVVEEIANREIDTWTKGQSFPVHPRMQSVTLEVILQAVFGVREGERHDRLRALLIGLLDATSSPRLQFRVLVANRLGRGDDPLAQLQQRISAVDELLFAEIAERRATSGDDGEDILSLLLSARFEDGGGLSDRDLRDQLVTLLLAGHETTATALAWTFDLLLRHPDVLARLRDELQGGEGDAYLRAVIAESLRLRPVVPLAGRRLTVPLEVDGLSLPAGTDVTPAIWLTHTRSEEYPDPLAFRPERFLDGGPSTYAWIPFGGGVRRCIGAAFAELEMRVVLRAVLSRCALRLADDRPERIARRNVTFSPRRGTRVVLV